MEEAKRIAIYLSPGWHDFWSVTWEIFHETFRGILRTATICLLGHQGRFRIEQFCKEKNLPFLHYPETPSLLSLRTQVRPTLLMVFCRDRDACFEYGIQAYEAGIPTVIKLRLYPE